MRQWEIRRWWTRAAPAAEIARARARLLRLLLHARPVPTTALVALHLVNAVCPTLHALAVGHLILVAADASDDRRLLWASVLVAGLLLLDQMAWLLRQAVRDLVVRQIDGALRDTVRMLATSAPTLDRLETTEFHDLAARAVDGGISLARTRSPGTAAAGQLLVVFRMLAAVSATVLVATRFPVLAMALLTVSLVGRAIVRRQWIRLIDILDADVEGQRRMFYLSELAVTGAAKEVRMLGLAYWVSARFRATAISVYAPAWRELWGVLRRQWLTLFLATSSAVAALAVPAAAVLSGELSSGALVTYVLAAMGILAMSGMGHEAYDIEYGLRGMTAAEQLTAAHATTRPATTTLLPAPETPPVIRFEGVSFTHPGADRPTIDGLCLTLWPGQTVALVGRNGVGKTTFVKLLSGLYAPQAGRITVDGVDVAEVEPALWRSRLAVLFQEFNQYPASLADNVALASPEHLGDVPAIRDALGRAGLADLPERLPHGLDTLLWHEGAGGTNLSGGQWQRVALARALFAVNAGRRVLVLDEPTAHLDVRAEAEFHAEVVSSVQETTTLLISHRLSTVRPADRILLLDGGRIVEDGTHDELMALDGEYARYFRLQAETFATPGSLESRRSR
ncbi:ABC transporter ATP-binding protein [Actinoplanes utahensis]|uniref:ABC transporter domain-containing protein n=2 Tax=Actinoplanes utahensis TaxID=1869 RepID=A0A0A6US57_ACTUT|nr:hypothetical protein MB27_05305 [Actinoplanes utahensis]GIF28861.1 multidrug ABC transporter permease [Actinoplanes utahensis]